MPRRHRTHIRCHQQTTPICAGRRYRQLLRQDKPSSAPGQDTHQPTLRSTSKGVAQSGGGRQRHFYANRRRDATRRSSFTPPCKHCASWPRSRSETSRGTRKKLQRRQTGHPPDTLHPICRRLRGVQQYMGRHTTMQRGYPGMGERHGARTARRQNTVRPHPRAKVAMLNELSRDSRE